MDKFSSDETRTVGVGSVLGVVPDEQFMVRLFFYLKKKAWLGSPLLGSKIPYAPNFYRNLKKLRKCCRKCKILSSSRSIIHQLLEKISNEIRKKNDISPPFGISNYFQETELMGFISA